MVSGADTGNMVTRFRWSSSVVSEFPGGSAVPAGRIKKIIPDRGFGFVRADDGNEVFFHRTELTSVDFDSLQEGESVTFDIVDSPKGPRARNMQKTG
jgi:cold shock protein